MDCFPDDRMRPADNRIPEWPTTFSEEVQEEEEGKKKKKVSIKISVYQGS